LPGGKRYASEGERKLNEVRIKKTKRKICRAERTTVKVDLVFSWGTYFRTARGERRNIIGQVCTSRLKRKKCLK